MDIKSALETTMSHNRFIINTLKNCPNPKDLRTITSVFAVQLVCIQTFINPDAKTLKDLGDAFVNQYRDRLSGNELNDLCTHLADQIEEVTLKVYSEASSNPVYDLTKSIYDLTDTPFFIDDSVLIASILKEFVVRISPDLLENDTAPASRSGTRKAHKNTRSGLKLCAAVLTLVLAIGCAVLGYFTYHFHAQLQEQTALLSKQQYAYNHALDRAINELQDSEEETKEVIQVIEDYFSDNQIDNAEQFHVFVQFMSISENQTEDYIDYLEKRVKNLGLPYDIPKYP